MNQQTFLQKIARLRSLLARRGQSVDVVRFASDAPYARHILEPLLDTDDGDLLAVCVELMQSLGAVSVAPPAPHAGALPMSRPPRPATWAMG